MEGGRGDRQPHPASALCNAKTDEQPETRRATKLHARLLHNFMTEEQPETCRATHGVLIVQRGAANLQPTALRLERRRICAERQGRPLPRRCGLDVGAMLFNLVKCEATPENYRNFALFFGGVRAHVYICSGRPKGTN